MSNLCVFFLSTGRCGTQSVSNFLNVGFQDIAHIAHEPIDWRYLPNKYYRCGDDADPINNYSDIAKNFQNIENYLENTTYIEVGWPCFSAIPYFAKRLGNKVRIVNLIRDPIATCISLEKHGFYVNDYCNPNPWVKNGILSPIWNNVILKQYKEVWNSMSTLEKNLFRWAELIKYADELTENSANIEMLRIKFEDLMDPMKNKDHFFDFLGLPNRPSLALEEIRKVDVASKNNRLRRGKINKSKIREIIHIAEQFGYEIA